jgi:hypothetical protein
MRAEYMTICQQEAALQTVSLPAAIPRRAAFPAKIVALP